MRKVLFFIENEWAFGQIHHALIKQLWTHGIYSHLLDWIKPYNRREFQHIISKFDVFVTTPCRIGVLVNQYGVPPTKIVAIAHHLKDIYWGIQAVGVEFFNELGGYVVNHPDLIPGSKNYGISRVPLLVKVGIEFDLYYTPIGERIKTLGYAGAFFQTEVTGKECKRMHLAQLISEKTNIPIDASAKKDERLHFLAMPEFYKSIDCLIVPSTYETAGLPALEAAASGKLVISTNVGYFDGSFGELAQMDEVDFVLDAMAHIGRHRDDPALYRYVCEYSQQYVKDNFDWPVVIQDWINVLT